MRFKGTLVLLLLCVGLGAFLYFYEIKGGEQRDKLKQEEKTIWKISRDDIQQLDLVTPAQRITAVHSGDKQWKITSPRPLDADADELDRLTSSASDISREDVIEENAADLAPFGLAPAQTTLSVKTKDGKVHEIRFGNNNPTGNSTYAALQGKNQVILVGSSVASNFNKKLEDLRNHSILKFDQAEAQSLDMQSSKGTLSLVKEGDRWLIHGKNRWAADSTAVNSMLGDLTSGRIKEFFDESPEDYTGLGFEKPTVDLRLTAGKDKGIRHLMVGLEKSKLIKKGEKAKPEEKKTEGASPVLYLARDESRPELFFVEKEFVDKFLKSPADLRDKVLAVYQRFDIDNIAVTNAKGTVTLAKSQSGDWVVGKDKKKAKWDAVNEVFDALEKQVKEFVDEPGALSKYGLDSPTAHVVLKQGATVKADCIFGKDAKDGVYAQVAGEPFVKVADKESLAKLGKAEQDYLEPPPPPATPAPAAPKK
jgi:hypothetical protein